MFFRKPSKTLNLKTSDTVPSKSVFSYPKLAYLAFIRHPIQTIALGWITFSTFTAALASNMHATGINQCPLKPSGNYFGNTQPTCAPFEEFLPLYHVIMNTVSFNDVKIFHFVELHSQDNEHVYTNGKMISLLANPDDVVLLEGLGNENILSCNNIYYNQHGDITNAIATSPQRYIFDNIGLKCHGWESTSAYDNQKMMDFIKFRAELILEEETRSNLINAATDALKEFLDYLANSPREKYLSSKSRFSEKNVVKFSENIFSQSTNIN